MIVPTIDVRAIDSSNNTVSFTETKNFQNLLEYFRTHLHNDFILKNFPGMIAIYRRLSKIKGAKPEAQVITWICVSSFYSLPF